MMDRKKSRQQLNVTRLTSTKFQTVFVIAGGRIRFSPRTPIAQQCMLSDQVLCLLHNYSGKQGVQKAKAAIEDQHTLKHCVKMKLYYVSCLIVLRQLVSMRHPQIIQRTQCNTQKKVCALGQVMPRRWRIR
jgi:hypothetical protein